MHDLYIEHLDKNPFDLLAYGDNRYTQQEVYQKVADLAWRLKEDFGVQMGDRISEEIKQYVVKSTRSPYERRPSLSMRKSERDAQVGLLTDTRPYPINSFMASRNSDITNGF